MSVLEQQYLPVDTSRRNSVDLLDPRDSFYARGDWAICGSITNLEPFAGPKKTRAGLRGARAKTALARQKPQRYTSNQPGRRFKDGLATGRSFVGRRVCHPSERGYHQPGALEFVYTRNKRLIANTESAKCMGQPKSGTDETNYALAKRQIAEREALLRVL